MTKRIGPPKSSSNSFVLSRLQANCKECVECGAMSHYKAVNNIRKTIQVHINGMVIAVRRAMYMASFPNKEIQKNRRITSRCRNPHCINAKLLLQATPGQIVKLDYEKGNRDKAAVVAHLARYTRALNTKLSDECVDRIRMDERTGKWGAADYGITPEHFNAIKRGVNRRGSNPFAGLMA